MRKSAYECTQTPTYVYCVSPLLLTILEICKLHVIPYKKGVLDSYDYLLSLKSKNVVKFV